MNRMDEIVDVGAFRCPKWYAEGMMLLIELEAIKQKKLVIPDIDTRCNDWLIGNGFAPLPQASQSNKGRMT